MPLKLVRRTSSPFWWIRGTIGGQLVRESTRTADARLAEEYRATREAEAYRCALHGAPARVVTFDQALLAYLREQARPRDTKTQLAKLLRHFGPGKPCRDIDLQALDAAARAILRPGYSQATKLRHIVTPTRAVLSFAAERGWCQAPRFRIKGSSKARTEWLSPAQADALLDAAGPHMRALVAFLIGTGARLGEALRLAWADVDLAHGRARLRETKNSSDRMIELPPRIAAELERLPGRSGPVFRKPNCQPYPDRRDGAHGGQIRSPWASLCAKAGLPGETLKRGRQTRFRPVITPHACRHTWASWHYAMHRDLLRLKIDGGWRSTAMVERYTKLVPPTMAPAIAAWIGAIPAHDDANHSKTSIQTAA